MMIIRERYLITITVAVLFFSMAGISYQQLPFLENDEGLRCIYYEAAEKTITIDCDHASFGDLISTIYDRSLLEKLEEDGEYLLKANLRVADGASFGMTSSDGDRKSTRLNSSHANISYAVLCLKKKNL